MPLPARRSGRRTRTAPNEKLPERRGEASAQVMAPTRMKLRVRRRDNATEGAGDGQPEEQEATRRESVGRNSRRKNTSRTPAAPAAAASSSSPPTSSASASVRAVMAAEEASPDSKCPICLDRFNNLAYLDRCLHRFCFPCIQEWSHNKPECPLCKQPFTSILHSVRAENDFKEYTLRPAPADNSIAATVAMVAAMASRIDHRMRLQLRRHRVEDGGETTTRRRRRERGTGGGTSRRAGERTGVLEWYLDSNPLPHPPPPYPPVGTDDSDDAENLAQQSLRGEADLAERGVIFEGLTGLGGAVAPVAPTDRASRRLMTRLAARQRTQREGGTVRRLREREMVAFRRALYRCGIQVRGVAGVTGNQGQQQRDITAESFRQNSAHLNRLRPWLRRELTVLYGAHGVLVHIVQRIIMARLARHGLEDTPTIEEELRPFLLARTDHFLHELVSFARSPLSLDNYDLQAVYEPPDAALELDGVSSSSASSSVIAISEGEEEERQVGGRSDERLQGTSMGAHDIDIQSGSCLSLSAWDDETPGPSYSTAEPSCSLAPLSFSPAPQDASNEVGVEKRDEGEAEEECLIVGYKKPIAERTPELVQLSSDTEEDDQEKKEEEEKVEEEKPPPVPSTTPPLSYLPTVPPSTSGTYRDKQTDDKIKEKDVEAEGRPSRARSWSCSSGRSHETVFTLSPSEQRQESWRERKQSGSEAAKEKRRRKKRKRGRERSSEWLKKSGTLFNPNRSIYPAMMHRRSLSRSPFHSSIDSGSPLPPSPPDSSWDFNCSPLTSSVSSPSPSSVSPLSSSPQPSLPPQTPPTPSLSPRNPHNGEKPGGKRKYKSRHLDSNDKDPTWRPSSSQRREKRRKRMEKERRKRRGRDRGRRRERHRRGTHKESGDYGGESSRRCREDRSPSVEIIYEGTITSDMTQPPAAKRRRKRHRKAQHTSSPVIITLDSDSSHDDGNNKHISSSSSPLSSQQTVDFSDLPPLPLVHSGSASGGLETEIGELPVDILDHGSDGSDTEPVNQSEAAGPIENKDNSDREVDVETIEGSSSVLGCKDTDNVKPSDTQEPLRKPDAKASEEIRETVTLDGGSEPTGKDVDKTDSDSHLLATVLNDLRGISAPQCDVPFNFEPSYSPESRNRLFRNPCEVNQAHLNKESCLAERNHPTVDFPVQRQTENATKKDRGLDLSTCHATFPSELFIGQPNDYGVREDRRDISHLKEARPSQSYDRKSNRQKDGGNLGIFPIPPVNVHLPHITDTRLVDFNSSAGLSSERVISPPDLHLAADLARDNQAIPPITALKRHFTSTLALGKELASTSSISASNMHSSCHLAPNASNLAASTSFHSDHVHSVSENSFTSADNVPELDRNSSTLHSSHESTSKISTGHQSSSCSSLVHPMNLCANDFHLAKSYWSTEEPAHTDSTSGGCRDKGRSTYTALPIDLHPCSNVSAKDTSAAGGIFSGANSNNTSPLVTASSTDSTSQNSNSPIDSRISNKKENLLRRFILSSSSESRLSPTDTYSRSRKSAVDPESSAAPTDVYSTKPAPMANPLSFNNSTSDRHFNHAALSNSPTEHTITFNSSPGKCASQIKPIVASNSELHHLTDSDSNCRKPFDLSAAPQLPTDRYSKHTRPIDCRGESQTPTDSHPQNSLKDFRLHTSNHVTHTPQSVENQWNSNSLEPHADSQLSVDERSGSSVWNTHTLPHRTDK